MSNHEEDKLFKYATKEDGFSFINLIEEINWDIRKYDFKSENLTFNPTELIELDPAVYKSDMIMELDSIIVITEFQSTVVKKFDEKRYRLYTAIVDYAKQNNKPILLIIFSTAEKTKIKQNNTIFADNYIIIRILQEYRYINTIYSINFNTVVQFTKLFKKSQ